MNGPERSTTIEMKTTTAAVIAILKTSSSQNVRSGGIIFRRHPEVRANGSGLEVASPMTGSASLEGRRPERRNRPSFEGRCAATSG